MTYLGVFMACFRGLLLPKVVTEDYGVKRTDIGHLGAGIYFTDSAA
jgi:poly [ADP-ribose] polymerase